MSTFSGKIEEIPEISIDRFNDHMRGLEDWTFHKSLINRPDVFLYASPISVRILKGLYPTIESKLKELLIGASTLIKLPYTQNKCISVTLLPAGHCPGSVMFLFETEKRVLYTGDYRVSVNDLKKYHAFYSLGKLKKFDKIYLDTTFFKRSFSKLPLRQESLQSICQLINDWIKQSKKHTINIALSARYGSEYLFLELSKQLCMPIHVSSETYRTYKYIPEMDKAVTLKCTETQVHAGCGRNMKNICVQAENLVRVIKPSTLWWENDNFSKGVTAETEKGEYRVCYSCHASFEEIKEFLLFLKPTEIEPCVVPNNPKEKEIMLNLLEDVIKTYKDESDLKDNNEIKLFNIEQVTAETATVESSRRRNCDILRDILESPTKDFKRKRL